MMNSALRTLLFLSAFAPVAFSLAYVRWTIVGWSIDVFQLGLIGLLGSALPYLILKWIAQRSEILPFKAKKVEDAGFMLFVFVFAYISPIIMRSIGYDFESALWVMFFVGVLLWLIPSIPAHPVLRVFRIRFYKVESENGMVYTVISRDELRSPTDLKKVHIISSAMLIKAN